MLDKDDEGMAFQIPDYSTSTQPTEEQYYTPSTSTRVLQGSQGEERPSPSIAQAFEGCLKALNIDALTNIDDDIQKGSEQESYLLLKKLEQLRGVGRCISLTLLALSVVYFLTRVANYLELKDARAAAMQSFHLSDARVQLKFENIAMLHLVTIVHSLTCIIISGVVAKIMRSQSYIDRR